MRVASHTTARPRQAGFTLVEVMISLALMALMMTMAWATLSRAGEAKTWYEEVEVRSQEFRVASARMAQDLASAYLSLNETTGAQAEDRRTLFIGTEDELRFSSLGHRPMWANADESEQTMIQYFVDSDRLESGERSLYRRELRRPVNDTSNRKWDNAPAEIDVLVRGIEDFELEYFDYIDNEWKTRWNSTSADAERNRLPTRVRIKFTVANEEGAEIEHLTQARIYMEQQINLQK